MGISNEMPCALASNENERLREAPRNVGPLPTFTHDRRRDAAAVQPILCRFSDVTAASGAATSNSNRRGNQS